MKPIWKYMFRSKVKHLFYSFFLETSVCGTRRMWYHKEQWRMDRDGLNSRRECQRCLLIDRTNTSPAVAEVSK
jgi:hypothetical protein